MMINLQLVLAAIVAFSPYAVRGQRGCPTEGCDPRGLNCQADFQVDSSKARILWQVDLGNQTVVDDMKTLGCVGNSANVICKVSNSESKGFAAIEASTGRVKWYDTLMDNPRFPIMNAQGDIIATDGQHMEMRLSNGSLAGKPTSFLGYLNDTSSIHYVEEPNLFFFVSYQSGGMYMFDTSGMCVASNFLNEKDPITNQTVSVWIAITRLIVNTEIDPPCTYFIAQNNVTKAYRVYAVNFNHQPPYLLEKWHLDIQLTSPNKSVLAGSRLIVRGSVIIFGIISGGRGETLVVSDEGIRGVLSQSLDMYTITFASFDFPAGTPGFQSAALPLIWMNTMDEGGQTIIRGWDSYNKQNNVTFKYSINLSKMSGLESTSLTSELMVFGYHPEDTTLVFAYTGLTLGKTGLGTGNLENHLVAVKPMPDGSAHTLWDINIGLDFFVIGQIIGVDESTLLATAVSHDGITTTLLGVKIGD